MKKRILVVEDQADIRKLIRTTLEFEYYEIYEASDAAEALEAVKRLHPQLLLLDIMMPGGMNGLSLCRPIKSDPSLGPPQVVMLSALSSSQRHPGRNPTPVRMPISSSPSVHVN